MVLTTKANQFFTLGAGRAIAALAGIALGLTDQLAIDCAVGSNSRASSQAFVPIGPTPPAVAGTPPDRLFEYEVSDTPENDVKGVHKTGSTPVELR